MRRRRQLPDGPAVNRRRVQRSMTGVVAANGGGGGGGVGRIFVRAAMLATTGATVSPDAGSDVPRVR